MATFVFSAFSPKFKELQLPGSLQHAVHKPSDRLMKSNRALHRSAAGKKRESYNKTSAGACMALQATSSEESKADGWGEVFEWEIKGAGVEEVWAVTGDFAGVDKWSPDLIHSCERVEGQPQKVGCVRKVVVYPEPFTFFYEKLLSMDEPLHHYTYSIIGGTTVPGFSLLHDYVGTFKLSPLKDQKGTLLLWGYACCPISTLSQEQTNTMVFSLFQGAVDALKAHLALPDDNITLISKS